jgi:HlyD family secretion protein
MKRVQVCTAAVVVLFAIVVASCERGATAPPAKNTAAAPTAAPSGLRLVGTVEAVRSRTVAVPRLAGTFTPMIITRLVKGGSRVEAGDIIVTFDPQEQQRIAADRRAEVVDLEGQIEKRRAEHAAAEAKERTAIVVAENDVVRAELAVRTNELIAKVAADKNDLALEQALARLKLLKSNFELRREAAAADLKILTIRRDRADRARAHAEGNASLMEIRAPFAGLAVIKTMYRSGPGMVEILEGDEVRPGVPVVDIVDTSAMLVRARVNQADAVAVQPGLRATVRLDGFPDLSFPGRIEQVMPLATTSNLSQAVRSFVALVSIDATHQQLLPDLTASVEIVPAASAPATAGGR